MSDWHMLALVGKDREGIVAAVTQQLFDCGYALGEASMIRLGGSFTIMLMVSGAESDQHIQTDMQAVLAEYGLCMHVDPVSGGLHQHQLPNVVVRVMGADRSGIVADVTGALAEQGMNILELSSDVAGVSDNPVYIMQIEGYSEQPISQLQQAVAGLNVDANVSELEAVIG